MADQRYTGKQEEDHRGFRKLVKSAGVIGTAATAYRYRGNISRVASSVGSNAAVYGSRFLAKDNHIGLAAGNVRTLLSGVSGALGDNPSILRMLRGSYDKKIQSNMQRGYLDSIANTIQKRSLPQNQHGAHTTTLTARFNKEFIRKNKNGMTDFEYKATQKFREDHSLNAIRKRDGLKKYDPSKVAQSYAEFHKENGDAYTDPTAHIKEFTKQLENGTFSHKVAFNNKDEREVFQNLLSDTLNPYSGGSLKLFEANREAIVPLAQGMEDMATIGVIEKAIEMANKPIRLMKGNRRVSLKDMEKMSMEEKRKYGGLVDDRTSPENQVLDITTHLRNFLSKNEGNEQVQAVLKQKGINFDFEDMVLDSHLYINETTGQITDNRHLKEGVDNTLDWIQSNLKVPFLNINGVDLTPWQSLRSGKTKEGLHVLSAGQVHGFVRNIGDQQFDGVSKEHYSGAIRTGLSNSSNVYAGGNIFNLADNGSIKLVDEGLYLIPSQYGPFSRMHDNMTNMSSIVKPDERGALRKIADINRQEEDSHFAMMMKSIKKFDDPNYGPNALGSMVNDLYSQDPSEHVDIIKSVYKIMRTGIENSANPLSRKAADYISPDVNRVFKDLKVYGESFDFSRLHDNDYLLEASMGLHHALSPDGNRGVHIPYTNYNRRLLTSVNGEAVPYIPSSGVEDPALSKLKSLTSWYMEKPEDFISSRKARVKRNIPNPITAVVPIRADDEDLIPATEELRKAFHQYALRSLDAQEADFAMSNVKDGIRQRSSISKLMEAQALDIIDKKEVANAKDLELLTDLMSYSGIERGMGQESEAITFLSDLLSVQGKSVTVGEKSLLFEQGGVQLKSLGMDLQEGIRRAQPYLGLAPEHSKPPVNGADFIVMRKSNVTNNVRQTLSEINAGILERDGVQAVDGWDIAENIEKSAGSIGKQTIEAIKQTGQEVFAGRYKNFDSLENVTTTTGVMYGLAERLNNQLGNFGLSMSMENMGSFASIMTNQFLRRVALPYTAYQQAVYFDGLLGDEVSDTAADAYVNTHQTLQQVKDVTGINKAMRPWAKVFQSAGFDQIGEWAGVKQLDFMTFGLFTDFRSSQDVGEYYESGEDPVRKNRFWGIGSPSAWAGGGIEYYTPNWYRKAKSDYKFTDTMYGSESEYWANHWMPTLTNPLAPLKHFVLDPKHYERKHEDDRPYAITGGFSEIQNIPIIGPLVDGTIGRILKPRSEHRGLGKAHREYLAEVNNHIRSQYSPVHDGAYVQVSATGGVSLANMYGDMGTWGGMAPAAGFNGLGGSGPTIGADAGIVHGSDVEGSSGSYGGVGPGIGAGGGGAGMGNGSGSETARTFIAETNYALAQQGKAPSVRSVAQLQKMGNGSINPDIGNIMQADSLRNNFVDAFYSASELAGIYGFMTKTGMGYDESWRGTVLAPSSLMSSPNRAFWDMNLGGFGGSLSEIGRRYVPRDPNKDYYSPIRNTMPDWLPGIEGQEDFLHGDPYIKLAKGETRLPGKAYETLYQLHPDGTGKGEWAGYGTFDRFRILADVDPDSDQYKAAKHEISLLRQAGGISEEMDKEIEEIEAQVSSKQETIRWYDKKFSNADMIEKTVTVNDILDANTFTVNGIDSPIRLAGVKLTETNNPDAVGWLRQFIKPGEKLKISYAEDPVDRYNNDTYSTIAAVVHANHNEEGGMFFNSIKGQSLNEQLANRTWQSKVQIKDSGRAADTAALYSKDMITVGSMMETLTHNILPKVPILGIFADKFLQVRTPIESYKHDQIYSSDWRPWSAPYEGWIKPMINTVASQNPLLAGAEMAAIGWMFGRSAPMKKFGKIGGFVLGAGMASARVFNEGIEQILPGADGVWLPKERQRERDINEYFDRLKYVKYQGLYNKAQKMAMDKEGIDVNQFFEDVGEEGKKRKGLKRYLTDRKKLLNLQKKTGYGDVEAIDQQIDDFSNGIKEIDAGKQAYQAGRYTAMAIQYRKEYESTLYAMDGYATDRTALMRALTPKEREYVPKFMETTSSKERQEILKYVPKDIKRILQNSWGLEAESGESIESYFATHSLPNEDWAGWNASVNLDDIKIKVMRKKDVNPTSSGYWDKDQARAEKNGAKAIQMRSISSKLDVGRLRDALVGAGLSDVDIQLTTSYGNGVGGISTDIDIVNDVRSDILETINVGFMKS